MYICDTDSHNELFFKLRTTETPGFPSYLTRLSTANLKSDFLDGEFKYIGFISLRTININASLAKALVKLSAY